ncbi:MAG: putative lipid II flippase FtsW [Elusimicrobia bacterium]|nr:putative lipid II flippase FtsW [Elusimicrobiota bacterium]
MIRSQKKKIDPRLLTLILILAAFGLVMVYSASSIWADQRLRDPAYFLKRQALWMFLGLGMMLVFSGLNYNYLKEWSRPIMALCWIFLIATLFGPSVSGARRWIRLGSFSLQPSEFAKLAVIIFLSDYVDRKRSRLPSLTRGLLIPLGVVAMTCFLIALEPDIGTPILIFWVTLVMLFLGGVRWQPLAAIVLSALPVIVFEVLRRPYRRARLLAFLSPWSDAKGAGYQLVQAMLAVGSGGWLGKGLGSSELKLHYLPAPHTDFIFPVVCEELGLLGAMSVVALFASLFVKGIQIAKNAPNLFGLLLAAGITFNMAFQAVLNIAVSIGLLPTKGLALPFFSYGGSSIMATFLGMGILLNISKEQTR